MLPGAGEGDSRLVDPCQHCQSPSLTMAGLFVFNVKCMVSLGEGIASCDVEFEEDQQAKAIAAEWEIDPDLLEEADWEIETIDGDDGEVYGYLVRFNDATDPETLMELGVIPGQFTRQLSVNAFDEADADPDDYTDEDYDRDLRIREGEDPDGLYSIEDPFPDITDDDEEENSFPELPPGQAYVADETGRIVTDERGRGLTVTVLAATLKREVLSRLDDLEAALKAYQDNLPPRNHNNPPELVEPDPISQRELRVVIEATIEIKTEAQQAQPNPVKLEAHASALRKVAGSILSWLGRKADTAVDSAIRWGVPAALGAWALTRPDVVYTKLIAVAESVMAWTHLLSAGL